MSIYCQVSSCSLDKKPASNILFRDIGIQAHARAHTECLQSYIFLFAILLAPDSFLFMYLPFVEVHSHVFMNLVPPHCRHAIRDTCRHLHGLGSFCLFGRRAYHCGSAMLSASLLTLCVQFMHSYFVTFD